MATFTPHLLQGVALVAPPVTFWLLAHILRPIGISAISHRQRCELAKYIAAPAFENDLFSERSPRTRERMLRFIRSRMRIDGALCVVLLALATLAAIWSFIAGTPRGIWVGPYLLAELLVLAVPFGDAWMRGRDVYERALSDVRRSHVS